MRRGIIILCLIAGAALVVFLLARGIGRPALPNIVLVTLDTTRADHLGCYGYFRDTSPNLDAFADKSILFENAISPMSHTLPTHCSILTGTYPVEHGIVTNNKEGDFVFRSTERMRSLAELCRDQGYQTAAFVSGTSLKRYTGIDVGFDLFDQPETRQREGRRTVDRALEWLGETETGPFLLWVHFFDPHGPYTPLAPFTDYFRSEKNLERYLEERGVPKTIENPDGSIYDLARVNNNYDGEIRYMDFHFGRLIDALRGRPDWDDTAILVVGDHGEGMGQHDMINHGRSWDEQVRAPMMMRAPGIAPRRVPGLVSVVDAVPTLIGLLDLDEGPLFGRFLAQATGEDALRDSGRTGPVLSLDVAKKGRRHRTTLTFDRWKYHRLEDREWTGARHELYDLMNDPHELRNIAGERQDLIPEMERTLLEMLERQRVRGESLRAGAEEVEAVVDSVLAEELRALGYVD
ncbi:MAG: sulfatase [Candidatus Eisenbacteria bacterium]|nr:sulfatase [Candidatus Eisenbacteria bacterium]